MHDQGRPASLPAAQGPRVRWTSAILIAGRDLSIVIVLFVLLGLLRLFGIRPGDLIGD